LLFKEKDIMVYTYLNQAKLICVPKATNSTVTLTHYTDGLTTGTNYTFTISDSTHDYKNVITDIYSLPAIMHRLKLVHASSAETKGFEPLYLAVLFQAARIHTR
jgi:hypothetical protein